MSDELSAGPDVFLKSIFGMLGTSCVLISLAWIIQVFGFNDSDAAIAATMWMLSSAVVAGLGAGLLLAAHTDLARIA